MVTFLTYSTPFLLLITTDCNSCKVTACIFLLLSKITVLYIATGMCLYFMCLI